jgi:hypothetical protein
MVTQMDERRMLPVSGSADAGSTADSGAAADARAPSDACTTADAGATADAGSTSWVHDDSLGFVSLASEGDRVCDSKCFVAEALAVFGGPGGLSGQPLAIPNLLSHNGCGVPDLNDPPHKYRVLFVLLPEWTNQILTGRDDTATLLSAREASGRAIEWFKPFGVDALVSRFIPKRIPSDGTGR